MSVSLFKMLAERRDGLFVSVLYLGLLLMPIFEDNPYILSITNQIAIYLIVVLGLNLFIGYAGQISLGHAGFFGLGAYGSAILSTNYLIWPWVSMILAAVVVGIIACIIAVPVLKLSGHYLAMATLGFNIVVFTIMVQWDDVTGGPSGFAEIPNLSIMNWVIDDDTKFHYLIWSVALFCVVICLNLVKSSVGRGLAALAVDETAAGSLGVDTKISKIKVFILSAVFASVAGSLYAHYFTFINPDTFSIFASLDLVIMVIVGGMGSIWGSVFGSGIITILPEFLEIFESYKDIIHGLILVIILLFVPEGLLIAPLERVKHYLLMRRRTHA